MSDIESTTNPLVSVIVPVYNAERYLRRTLDSICNQTLRDIEIILVDDGSTDSSLSILEEYADRDSRITILQQKNQYAGVARNNGMKIAKGKYYSFLDADDLFEPSMLEKMVNRAEETQADMVLIKADTFQEEGKFAPMSYQLKGLYPEGLDKRAFNVAKEMPQLLVAFQPWAWDKLFRADYIRMWNFQFSDTHRVNDSLFVCPATAAARIVSIIDDETLAHYRRSSSQLSSSKSTFRDVSCVVANARLAYEKMVEMGMDGEILTAFCCRLSGGMAWTITQVFGEARTKLVNLITEFERKYGFCRYLDEALTNRKFCEMMTVMKDTARLYMALNRPQMYKVYFDEESPRYNIQGVISVVLPVYNASSYLREALDSLINQTYESLEIICVNDGSTDDSLNILREYAANDSRFVVLDGPNGGYGKAMNRGLAVASGEYFAILEPDDRLPLNAYEILYKYANLHQLDIAKGGLQRFETSNGLTKYTSKTSYPSRMLNRVVTPRYEQSAFNIEMHTVTCLYRLAFLRRYGITYHESPGASYQDNGMFMLSFAYADRLMCVNDIVYLCRRDNPNSSIHALARKIYAFRDEYAYIRTKLERTPEIWEKIKPVYLKKRLDNHYFTYSRILDSSKVEYLESLRLELMTMESYDRSMLSSKMLRDMRLVLQSPYLFLVYELMQAMSSEVEQSTSNKLLKGAPRVCTKERRKRAASLFYKKSLNRETYKFAGIPIWSKRKKGNKLVYSILGIPVYRTISKDTSL